MHELLVKQDDRTRLLKFIADPPTTTLQRLKGMTTGSLPTFIDIGSNFASPEINEDNIIDQIVRNNLSVVFMGDGTWTELFPNRFKRQYDYPSFDIFDLDTIDNEIQRYLPEELNKKDWDLLIAHFLGVDHCGHKYGPLHKEMSRKLSDMDQVIRNVIDRMDNDTVLLVAGDHGMTMTGDHGGETAEEVSALLFMYSKEKIFVPNYLEFDQALHQIDIVPTISTILGVPIPYSNLGVINFNLIPDVPMDGFPRHQWLLMHLWQNAIQIHEYFLQYASTTGVFNAQDIEALKHKFLTFSYRINTIKTETGFINFAKDLKRYLHEISQICRDLWVKFDPNLISQGLVITFTATFLIFIIMNYLTIFSFDAVFTTDLVLFIYISNFVVGALGFIFRRSFSMVTEEHAVIFSTNIFSLGILAYIVLQNWPNISSNMNKAEKFAHLPLRAIYIFSSLVFFSNSFLIQEQKILMYLVISTFIYSVYCLRHSIKVKLTPRTNIKRLFRSSFTAMVGVTLFAVFVIKITQPYFKCREEQGNCTEYLTQGSDTKPRKTEKFDLIPIVAVAVMAAGTRMFLKHCGNLTGYSFNVMVVRYGAMVAAVCTGGHFTLAKSSITHNVPQLHIDALAWVVYGVLLLQVVVLFVDPLLLYLLPNQDNQIDARQETLVSELFKKLKSNYENQKKDKIPIICGLATVYSAVFIAIGCMLSITLALLLGPNAAIGLFLVILAGLLAVVLHAVLRYDTASTLGKKFLSFYYEENINFIFKNIFLVTCLQPTFPALLTWFLLSHFGFYATSHQPTLSQIDWNAAFVGRSANYDHSNLISGLLIILNTFSSTVWFSVLYPLLVIGPFMYFGIIEARTNLGGNDYKTVTVNKTEDFLPIKEIDFDIGRGEVNLYESEKRFIAAAFKTASLFFVLQGMRVSINFILTFYGRFKISL